MIRISTRKPIYRGLLLAAVLTLVAAPWALAQSDKAPYDPAAEDAAHAAAKIAGGEPLPNQPVPLGGPPSNDNCDSPDPVAVPMVVSESTNLSNTDPEAIAAGFCGTSVSDPSFGVWYTVIGTGNTLTATTCQPLTNYDTKLTVFCDECADLQCIGGNDDQLGPFDPACDTISNGLNRGSTVSWPTQVGAEYRIFVHGFASATGFFELAVTDDGVPAAGAAQCLPQGACCDGADCTFSTEAECTAAGLEYQGDGTQCLTPNGAPMIYADAPGLAIPDNDPVGVSATITVPDSFDVADVDVDLGITHTFIGDLIITLTHGGTTVTLWDRACSGENDLGATADDEGPDLVCAAPTVGNFNPESADGGFLNAFDGMDAAGDWTLTVSDNAGADIGTLDTWALAIDGGEPVCTLPPVQEIPTLDRWGLVVLVAVLALLGGALLVRRRRTA